MKKLRNILPFPFPSLPEFEPCVDLRYHLPNCQPKKQRKIRFASGLSTKKRSSTSFWLSDWFPLNPLLPGKPFGVPNWKRRQILWKFPRGIPKGSLHHTWHHVTGTLRTRCTDFRNTLRGPLEHFARTLITHWGDPPNTLRGPFNPSTGTSGTLRVTIITLKKKNLEVLLKEGKKLTCSPFPSAYLPSPYSPKKGCASKREAGKGISSGTVRR